MGNPPFCASRLSTSYSHSLTLRLEDTMMSKKYRLYLPRNREKMKIDTSALCKSPLFIGIDEEEIKAMLTCLSARQKTKKEGAFVFRAGDRVSQVFLITKGSMHIVDEDFWGNRTIIETMPIHTLFGEAYVFAGRKRHLVSVVAAEDSSILVLDPTKLFEHCAKGCDCHVRLIHNTLAIVSEKIVRLTEKLGHIAQRTTREKILSYLSKCAKLEQSSSLTIPYSRQELADYLGVDRSALSHELSKLRKDGLLRYRKNYFELLA